MQQVHCPVATGDSPDQHIHRRMGRAGPGNQGISRKYVAYVEHPDPIDTVLAHKQDWP
jgi:hypothetical protein